MALFKNSNFTLATSLIVLVITLGLFFFLSWTISKDTHKYFNDEEKQIKVSNISDNTYELKYDDKTFSLLKNESMPVTIKIGEVLKVSSTIHNNSIVIQDGMTDVYITPNSIFSNLDSNLGELKNESNYTIAFNKSGSSELFYLQPGSVKSDILIGKGDEWIVVLPERDNSVLSKLKISSPANSLYFDGESLKFL